MILAAATAILASSMGQNIELSLEERQGILDALMAFVQPHHTLLDGAKLTPDQFVQVEKLPRQLPCKDQVNFRVRHDMGGYFVAQKLSKRWEVVLFYGNPFGPITSAVPLLNTDAEVISMAKWHFADKIKGLGLKVFEVVWHPIFPREAPRTAFVYVYQSQAKRSRKHPYLIAAWRRSDLALTYFSISPAFDPDLPMDPDPPADASVSRLLK